MTPTAVTTAPTPMTPKFQETFSEPADLEEAAALPDAPPLPEAAAEEVAVTGAVGSMEVAAAVAELKAEEAAPGLELELTRTRSMS
jgi:hypothetical protein